MLMPRPSVPTDYLQLLRSRPMSTVRTGHYQKQRSPGTACSCNPAPAATWRPKFGLNSALIQPAACMHASKYCDFRSSIFTCADYAIECPLKVGDRRAVLLASTCAGFQHGPTVPQLIGQRLLCLRESVSQDSSRRFSQGILSLRRTESNRWHEPLTVVVLARLASPRAEE